MKREGKRSYAARRDAVRCPEVRKEDRPESTVRQL